MAALTEDQFWAIIQRCQDFDHEVVKRKFAVVVDELDPFELRWFHYHYLTKFHQAETWPLRQYIGFVTPCDDDDFSDFKDWLVFQGRDRFERAIADPDSLTPDLRQFTNIFVEGGAVHACYDRMEVAVELEGKLPPPDPERPADSMDDYIADGDVPLRFPLAMKEFRESGRPLESLE